MNLYTASRQWADRPSDERFWTLDDARVQCEHYASTAVEEPVDLSTALAVPTEDGDLALLAVGSDGIARESTLTNWGFGQLARLTGTPADYMRRLPENLAAQCLNHGLRTAFPTGSKPQKAMSHVNGSRVLRSLTSERYGRFWNYEVFDRIIPLQADGWKVPPGRPSGKSGGATRPATEADVLTRKSAGGGPSVKVGDLIAPAGIYASDHDMFAFLVQDNYRIDDGTDGGLARGFFVENSEVGASSLRVTFFCYRHVCGNHIVWNASNVIEVSVRHIGAVGMRFEGELKLAIDGYTKSSPRDEEAMVRRAKGLRLGDNRADATDALFKILAKGRRGGLGQGMSLGRIAAAFDLAELHADTDGDPLTVWGWANGMTRLSQLSAYAGERAFLDRAASLALGLAA